MSTYEELAAARRAWIEDVLIPWCRSAAQAELRKAERDWVNVAGEVAPEKTLWSWAWSRFPPLVHPELGGLDEAREVTVRLQDGRTFTGFPDARRSERGELWLLLSGGNEAGKTVGPFSLDEIDQVVG